MQWKLQHKYDRLYIRYLFKITFMLTDCILNLDSSNKATLLTIAGHGADPTVVLLRPLLVVDVEFLGSLETLTTPCHTTTHCSHAGLADFAVPLIMLV